MKLDRDERDDWKIGRCAETIWDYDDDIEQEEDEEETESIS